MWQHAPWISMLSASHPSGPHLCEPCEPLRQQQTAEVQQHGALSMPSGWSCGNTRRTAVSGHGLPGLPVKATKSSWLSWPPVAWGQWLCRISFHGCTPSFLTLAPDRLNHEWFGHFLLAAWQRVLVSCVWIVWTEPCWRDSAKLQLATQLSNSTAEAKLLCKVVGPFCFLNQEH